MKTKEQKRNEFIEKSIKRHGLAYNYSKVEYVDSMTKVCIICPEHGEFWQTPQNHVRGRSCPKCANKKRGLNTITFDEFVKRAREVHGDKYDYSRVNIKNSSEKIEIICPIHGSFFQYYHSHTSGKQGCPKCAGRNLTQDEVIAKFREVHGDKYDYSKVVYDKAREKVCMICPKHGEFWQTPQKHILGQGCPQCAKDNKYLTTEEFIEHARKLHGDKYVYDKAEYKDNLVPVVITCQKHGDFTQVPLNHLQGCGCPKCANNNSIGENDIYEFLKEIGCVNLRTKVKDVIPPYEIDILDTDLNIGIEYDGLRWHSEQFGKVRNYHLMKTELCAAQGIRLIHIFEDEWQFKQDIVKSRLKNIFKKMDVGIYARDCVVREIGKNESDAFLMSNHIQGTCVSSRQYGLYCNDELLSVMTFGQKRISLGSKAVEGEYELLRFCNKLGTRVIGGAGKLLKYFERVVKPKKIISYADRRWSDGGLYRALGFEFVHYSEPNYFYVVGNVRENRFKYRKSELVKQGFSEDKSEHEIMLEREIYRIYDCGTMLFEKNNIF